MRIHVCTSVCVCMNQGLGCDSTNVFKIICNPLEVFSIALEQMLPQGSIFLLNRTYESGSKACEATLFTYGE